MKKHKKRLTELGMWQNLYDQLSEVQQNFIQMILNRSKSGKGRRYTTEQKALSLAIYKQSPKCYRNVLVTNLGLPSETTLKLFQQDLPFSSGALKKRLFFMLLLSKIAKNYQEFAGYRLRSIQIILKPSIVRLIRFKFWVRPETLRCISV